MTWRRTSSGWRHAPWWKVAINTALRALQPFVRRKWVVYTRCTLTGDPPTVVGYGFGRVEHRR